MRARINRGIDERQPEIIDETPEQEIERLEQVVAEYIKEEEKASEEARKLSAEKEEKAKLESKNRESDRDYLEAVFEDTGITDPEELRRLYNAQDDMKVAEEDLEAVLANFSDIDNKNPTQIENNKLSQSKQKRDEAKEKNEEAKKLEKQFETQLMKRGKAYEEQ